MAIHDKFFEGTAILISLTTPSINAMSYCKFYYYWLEYKWFRICISNFSARLWWISQQYSRKLQVIFESLWLYSLKLYFGIDISIFPASFLLLFMLVMQLVNRTQFLNTTWTPTPLPVTFIFPATNIYLFAYQIKLNL